MVVCGAGERGAVDISADKFFALTAMLAGFVPVDTHAAEVGATAAPSEASEASEAGPSTRAGTEGDPAAPRPAG